MQLVVFSTENIHSQQTYIPIELDEKINTFYTNDIFGWIMKLDEFYGKKIKTKTLLREVNRTNFVRRMILNVIVYENSFELYFCM